MRLNRFISEKELVAILGISILILTVILTSTTFLPELKHSSLHSGSESRNSMINTSLGYFQPGFFKIDRDERIIWNGVLNIYKPNETVSFKGTKSLKNETIKLRSWTYRGNRYSLRDNIAENPDFRVLVLGGSDTYGKNLPFNQSYAELLETRLNNSYDGHIEVVNGGIDSSGMIDHYIFLTTIGRDLDPDVVIIGNVGANKELAAIEDYKKSKAILKRIKTRENVENPSQLFYKVNNQIKKSYFERTDLWTDSDITRYGNKIQNYLEKTDTEFYIACGTPKCDILDTWAKRKNIKLVKSPNYFQKNPSSKYRFRDDHLNEKGHKIYYQNLYRQINWSNLYENGNSKFIG